MSAAQPHIAEIDAAVARGEWWRRVFDELSEVGMTRVEALSVARGNGLGRVAVEFCRLARAVRLAVVAAMRLDDILRGLTALRRLGADAIADARASAGARAEAAAAARERAKARREARLADIGGRVFDSVANETPNRDEDAPEKSGSAERDPLVEALNRRLTVDPASVDFDDLQLRETVLRICADLNITPDWSRWEAGDWNAVAPPPAPSPPPSIRTTSISSAAPKLRPPPLVHGLPGLTSQSAPSGFRPRLE